MENELPAKEKLINPKTVFITTSTYYPNWTEKEKAVGNSTILRGKLALETIKESTSKGFPVVLVDGGSGKEFTQKARDAGANVYEQKQPGMSPGRREAFRIATKKEDCDYICWTEPEKVSIVRDCLPSSLLPIFNKEADIVVPKRNEASLATYPDYQIKYETTANKMWNKLLRKYNLLTEKDDDLDVWFGPKFFRNEPKLLNFFLSRYEFERNIPHFLKNVNPEDWANATFLAIPVALKAGYKVKSVYVPYTHPSEQTELEKDSIEFKKKRQYQLKSIISITNEFLKLNYQKPSYLKRV